MVYEGCPMMGGAVFGGSAGGYYLNAILMALIFSVIFFGLGYLFLKATGFGVSNFKKK